MFRRCSMAGYGIALGALSVLLLSGCQCGDPPLPPCPPSPTNAVAQWRDDLKAGDSEQVLASTTETIDAGEEAEFYAEAFLFRGVAQLVLGENDASLEDLLQAEERQDQLITIDAAGETLLLYRALMVVYARLDDMDTAGMYQGMALELAPDMESVIQRELDAQELDLEVLP